MMVKGPIVAFALLALLAVASSVASAQGGGMSGHSMHMAPEIVIPKGARYTKADVEFMQGMIAHHAQAIVMSRMAEAMAANPGKKRPTMAMMRQTALYDRKEDWMVPVRAAQRVLSQFENLFKNMGDVENGFPKSIPLDQLGNRAEYDPEMLSRNLMFGTPDEVIAKLKLYEALGVDEFIYYASLGLGHAEQKRSMELFCREIIPAFA